MKLRTVSLILLMVLSVSVLLPFAGSSAHGLRQSSSAQRQNHYRGHSRAWWHRHRARLRMRRAAALAHRKSTWAPINPQPLATSGVPVAPTAKLPLPSGWTTVAGANSSEMKFRTDSGSGTMAGQAALAVVAQSRPNPAYLTAREEARLLAGVSIGDLRRIVIDKMMAGGGWVNNDFQRDVAGHRVFVVTAQTPADGRLPEKSWNFYFTEVNGRIYSLITNTPPEFSSRMAAEAESLIVSLQSGSVTNR